MSDPVAVFNALSADLRAKFADFSKPAPNLLVLHLLNNVPCVKENRFLTWWLSGSLCAGFDPIPCDPNNPEQVEWAIRLGLRQLETDEEWPDEPDQADEEDQEDQGALIWPEPAIPAGLEPAIPAGLEPAIPAGLVSPVPALPYQLEEPDGDQE